MKCHFFMIVLIILIDAIRTMIKKIHEPRSLVLIVMKLEVKLIKMTMLLKLIWPLTLSKGGN